MGDKMGWYAIYVKTGREEAVCALIRRTLEQIEYKTPYELLVPKRQIKERHQGGFTEKCSVMFPGYVLIGTEHIADLYTKTMKCKDLYRFLKSNGEFQEIGLDEISNIVYMADEEGVIGISDIYIENDIVKVTSGPLCRYYGWIKKIDRHKHRAKVLFMFQGHSYLIDLSVNFICKPTDGEVRAIFPHYRR